VTERPPVLESVRRDLLAGLPAFRRRRRMRTVASAAVVVVAAAIGVTGLAVRDGDDDAPFVATDESTVSAPPPDPTSSSTEDAPSSTAATTVPTPDTAVTTTPPLTVLADAVWEALPAGPADGRIFPGVAWTGQQLVVWGGETTSEQIWADEGVTYDVQTGTWEPIADGPLTARSEHVAVWTGTEVVVCCGRAPTGDPRAAAAYDPATDAWRELAAPPDDAEFAVAVWTGSEVVVLGGTTEAAMAYDPDTDTWRTLPAPPRPLERRASAAWTGDAIVAWPTEGSEGLVYRPDTDTWETLPPLPDALAVHRGSMVWTGTEIVVWGASARADTDAVGARLPASARGWGDWQALADDPLPPTDWYEGTPGSQAMVWTGAEVVVWAGAIGSDGSRPSTPVIAYDPQRDAWRTLPETPTTGYAPDVLVVGDRLAVLANGPVLTIQLTP
jgi:hypothetical protein